ncbi:Clavaminate synthase-like protein [Xylaria intraflava]|nr:Clavaminate synthase-like protein [Xylaria intraflava]
MAASCIFGRSQRLVLRDICIASNRSLQCRSLYFSRHYSQAKLQYSDGEFDEEETIQKFEKKMTKRVVDKNAFNSFRKMGLSFRKYQAAPSDMPGGSGNLARMPGDTQNVFRKFNPPIFRKVTEPDDIKFKCRIGDMPPIVASRPWLRDTCTCDRCIDPHSGQKLFAACDVPNQLPIQHYERTPDGSLQIQWKDDFFTGDLHTSTYPTSIWQHVAPGPSVRNRVTNTELWTSNKLTEASPFFPYDSLMADGPEYLKLITTLSRYGIIILRDVPSSEEAVIDMAQRLGTLHETFYGRSWDVVAKPDAENVAYTSSALDLHQDLLYMYNIPRLQILHCLKNTVRGGESIFSDGFAGSYRFREQYPGLVQPLKRRRVIYTYNKSGHMYRQSRSVLSKVGLFWSPSFQSPVQLDALTMDGMARYAYWRKAARIMRETLEYPTNVFEHKLQPGECVIFDNRRVLHGRRAFDSASGERWLKGAYVENDSYVSKLMSLGIFPRR